MSAGIIVMNKNAIAMAADSAVTVGDHAAIHNSANKLFALSMFEPIGVIIYANAQFMQIPMEIIIKQYKTELGRKSFPTLRQYVADFVNFLESHADLFHYKANEEAYVMSICSDILQGLANGYTNRIRQLVEKADRPPTNDENRQIQEDAFNETITFIDAQKKSFAGFADYVRNSYSVQIKNYIGKSFPWVLNPEMLFDKICYLFDTDFMRHGYMGAAVAGYGTSEIFPHMLHLKISGVLNGKLRYITVEETVITENNQATITPLAQTDVMYTFILGYNDVFLRGLAERVPASISAKLASIDENTFGKERKELVQNIFCGFSNEVIQSAQDFSRKVYAQPLIFSIATLPIEELALFAESMINITSVRRRVTIDGNIGTVGGPIDVAIVTRGDGLIWLKRKHYFEAKKNPQYIYSRYGQAGVLQELNEDDEG